MNYILPMIGVNTNLYPRFKQNKTNDTSNMYNPINENISSSGLNALASYNTYLINRDKDFNIPTLRMIPIPEDISKIDGEKVYSNNGDLECVITEKGKYKIIYKNDQWKTIELVDKDTNELIQSQNCMVANTNEVRVFKENQDTGIGYFTDYDEVNGNMVIVGQGKHIYYSNDTKKEFIRWIDPQTNKESFQVIERSHVSKDPLSCDRVTNYDEYGNLVSVEEYDK